MYRAFGSVPARHFAQRENYIIWHAPKGKKGKAEYMLEWSSPQITDRDWICQIASQAGCMASDVSFANIYLLRDKYDIQISSYKDFLIRHYNGYFGRSGYTFPIGRGNIGKALEEIEKDAVQRNEELKFCLLTDEQKNELEKLRPGRFTFTSNAGDSDYIYAATELVNLSGKAFHKKKNHFSKFTRTYPEYRFAQIGQANIDDAVLVEDMWYNEHLQQESESQLKEYTAIKNALDNFEQLSLSGGIIYVNDTPAAMTIASKISSGVWDIHFEKAVGECALNGGYAAINRIFAETLKDCEWINREEDIGIEGLRKAKMSYHPKMLLKKYNARCS
jgi:hypothetical protein